MDKDKKLQSKNQHQHLSQNDLFDVIPRNIIFKTQYSKYKSSIPNYVVEISTFLYNYLFSLPYEKQILVEIEMKLGSIIFAGDYQLYNHINNIFVIPEIRNESKNYVNFISNVGFYFPNLWFYLQKEAKFNNDIILHQPIFQKEFTFSDSKGNSKRLGYTLNSNLAITKLELITKSDKTHKNIKCNPFPLDFRVSCCLENEDVDNEDDILIKLEKIKKVLYGDSISSIPNLYREKFRLSFIFNYFQLDFTIVKSITNEHRLMYTKPLEEEYIKTFWADQIGDYTTTYEVEIELKNIKHLLDQKIDYGGFELLINRMVENVLMLIKCVHNNQETLNNLPDKDYIMKKVYDKVHNNKEIEKLEKSSLFGDYFQYNC